MKKIFLILLPLCMVLSSCEDFLTQKNPNKIESEYYFTDEASLEIYTNGLVRAYGTAIKSFIDGDKYADTHSWDGQLDYLQDSYSASIPNNWTTSQWSSLRSINYYLDNMRNASASEDVLNHYEGVGRFFRAMFYFDKLKTFGAVPWYETSIDATDQDALYKARDSRELVAQKILDDLNYACENCSDDAKYRNRASLIHKYVALTLKARFCLFEGTFRKYHKVDPSTGKAWTADESVKYLEECADACEKIMASGVYSLIDVEANRKTQYREMFTAEDGCSSQAAEWIWARDYDITLAVTYAINDYMVNPQHANYAFTRQFINTYLMTDGTPFTTKYPEYDKVDFTTECLDRDYRLCQTIRHPGFTRDKGKTTNWAPNVTFSKTGYQPIKWLTDDSTKDLNISAIATDVPLMRYAEVLLSYAEAKAELGEMSPEIWNATIAPLRERAGVKSVNPATADPYMVEYFQNQITDPVILEIRRERGIELTMENQRYYDIIRWHQGELFARPWKGIWIESSEKELDLNNDGVADTFVTTDSKSTSKLYKLMIDGASEAGHKLSEGTSGNILPATLLERKWQEKKYVRPVPSIAISQNPNLSQNYGWE